MWNRISIRYAILGNCNIKKRATTTFCTHNRHNFAFTHSFGPIQFAQYVCVCVCGALWNYQVTVGWQPQSNTQQCCTLVQITWKWNKKKHKTNRNHLMLTLIRYRKLLISMTCCRKSMTCDLCYFWFDEYVFQWKHLQLADFTLRLSWPLKIIDSARGKMAKTPAIFLIIKSKNCYIFFFNAATTLLLSLAIWINKIAFCIDCTLLRVHDTYI